MQNIRLSAALCTLILALGSVPAISIGASAQASIKIEQLSPSAVGVWTMLSSNGTIRTSLDLGINPNNYSFGVTDYGPTTLSVTPPAGMTVRIRVYRGGEEIAQTDAQQQSFTLVANDNYRLVLQYALSKLGSLGITSIPSDVRFRARGPDGRTFSGRTPEAFTNIPLGRYTFIFPGVNGCTEASRQNAIVKNETRNTLGVTLASCTATEDKSGIDNSRVSKRSLREQVEQRELKPRGERR